MRRAFPIERRYAGQLRKLQHPANALAHLVDVGRADRPIVAEFRPQALAQPIELAIERLVHGAARRLVEASLRGKPLAIASLGVAGKTGTWRGIWAASPGRRRVA